MRDNETELQAIYDNVPIAIILLDSDRRIIKANKKALADNNFTKGEIADFRSGDIMRCIHASDSPHGCGYGDACTECVIRNTVKETFDFGKNLQQVYAEFYYLDDNSEQKISYFLISTSLIDVNSQPRTLVYLEDITKIKLGEKQTKEALSQYYDIYKATLSGIAIYQAIDGGNDFIFIDINPAGEKLGKVKRDEIVGKKITDIFPGVKEFGLFSLLQETYKTGEHHFLPTNKYSDSRITEWAENSIFRLPSGNIIVIFNDKTEEYHINQQLNQTEKMNIIGQLAGGIAHDFNNQLSGIMGFTELLLSKIDNEKLIRYVRGIKTATENAATLTNELLNLSRKKTTKKEHIQINLLVAKATSLFEHGIGNKKIKITQTLKAMPSVINGNSSLLENVFLNIMLNARDAMPDGGEVNIITDNKAFDSESCRKIPFDITPGEFVKIVISDTGSGIDSETIKHIFEPFFTTKAIGKGTGLGLANACQTICNHNGAITVRSQNGKGTTFEIYLPLGEECPDSNSEAKSEKPQQVTTSTASIMVIDDEVVVCEVSKELLLEYGYRVVAFTDSKKALRHFEETSSRFDLVICDMMMPKMDGKELLTEIKK